MLPPFDYEATARTGYWYYTKGVPIKHLTFQHPEPVEIYLKRCPELTSVTFEFGKSAYQKGKFDQFEQLNQMLINAKLTRLSISGSKQLKRLPESIKLHSLKSLTISNCPNIVDIKEVLESFPELEALELNGKHFNVGDKFPHIPKLRFLKIQLETISSLEGLSKCEDLESLVIYQMQLEKFPEDFSRLSQLRKVEFWNLKQLKALPIFTASSSMERIHLMNLPEVTDLEMGFSNFKNLKFCSLIRLGNVAQFPINITKCTQLETLNFSSLGIKDFPKEMSNLKALQVLTFSNLPVVQLPEIFDELSILSQLNISACPELKSLPKTFGNLAALTQLNLQDLYVEKIDFDFSELKKLERLNIISLCNLIFIDESMSLLSALKNLVFENVGLLKELPPLGKHNSSLTEINFRQMEALEKLPKSITDLPSLEKLQITASGIRVLPEDIGKLNTLAHLYCLGESVEKIPLDAMTLPQLKFISVGKQSHYNDKNLVNITTAFNQIKKIENIEIQQAITFWIGGNYKNTPLTKEMKIRTLESLSYSVKNYPLLVFSKIHLFNPNNAPANIGQLKEGDKVWVNGKIQGTKTDLKNKLKALGFTVVNKFSEEVKLVVVGQKATVPDRLFDESVIFASQLEVENLSKVENPGLLQKEDVPEDFIHNLQQLIWSADPQNEAVALELVKGNGLPEAVEEDFIMAAKSCKDQNVKNRIRNFLKGKISEAKQKALSIPTAPTQVHKLAKVLSPESMIKIYFAHYKRTGMSANEFLKLDDGTHPGRAEVFQSILPSFIVRPNFIRNYYPSLLQSEWNQIFLDPILKGKLKTLEATFTKCNALPEVLVTEHLDTLKRLNIRVSKSFNFESLYPLVKLNYLQVSVVEGINCTNTVDTITVPMGIGQMKRLSTLNISTTKGIEMPDDILELKKLKYCDVKFANGEKFKEELAQFHGVRWNYMNWKSNK